MKKLFSILAFILVAASGYGQAKIAADGSIEPTGNFPALKDQHLKGSMRVVADTTSRNAIPSLFRKQGMLVQTISPFTLWRLDSTSSPIWQPFTTGSTTTSLPWDSITGKPTNFNTTYALSNDIADSIQARAIVKDNADYRIVTGTANVKELKAQSRLNFYPDSGIMVVSAAPGSGYGAEIDFDNIATNGTQWGLYGGSTSVPGMVMYRYIPSQIELAYWDADRYALRNDVKMAWSSTALAFGTPDVAIVRDSVGRLQINNGTTNTFADLRLRNLQLTSTAGTGTRMVVADASGNITTQTIPSSPVTSVFGRTGAVTAQSGDYSVAQITGLQTALDAKQNTLGYTAENTANKGVANGYADLDANGKVPASRIDFGQTGQTYVVASQSEMLAITGANIGALAVRTDQNRNYRLIAQPASTLGNWIMLLSPDAPVQSVNGQTGNVNLLTTNISEGSNLYFTDARARNALSAGTGISYNSSTGTISSTITQYTDALARASLSAGTGISYNSSTGVISSTITQYTDALARAALSFAAGSGAYNSSTGVITIPTNTNQLTNGAGFITGINSSMVTGALGYTPPQPNGTGASGTWGINITGNAATAGGLTPSVSIGTVSNIVARNAAGEIYIQAPNYTSGVNRIAAWNASTGRIEYYEASQVQSILGLGSYAYRSSGLAELSGATFTGNISTTTNYRFNGNSFSQLAIVDVNGGFAGGYNFNINSGTAQHDATGTSSGYWYKSDGSVNFYSNSSASAGTALSTRLFISSGGNVGIGTNSPSALLHVNGTSQFTGAATFSSSVTANSFTSDVADATGTVWYKFRTASTFTYGDFKVIPNGIELALSGSGNRFSVTGGNVGIGTTSPNLLIWNRALTINATSGNVATELAVNGISYGYLAADANQVILGATEAIPLRLRTSNTDRLVISSTGAATFSSSVTTGGFVSVVTNDQSTARILVQNTGTGGSQYAMMAGDNNVDQTGFSILKLGFGNILRFNSSNAATFASSVTATSFFESSDLRQKNVHTTLISKDGINPIQYTFIPDGKQKWGYGAQQVQGILPYAVTEDDKGFLKVDYTTVHTYKIAMLEQRIAELEKQKEHTAHLAARVMDLQAQILELKSSKK